MIYVTVGTQLPFDRLINHLDQWAADSSNEKIIAQVGPSEIEFPHLEFFPFVSPSQSNKYFQDASLIIAHAGMGSVLTALKYHKPIIIFPRKASLGEHRNEHQMATARWLENKVSIHVAWNDCMLIDLLSRRHTFEVSEVVSDYANPDLITNLQNFVNGSREN